MVIIINLWHVIVTIVCLLTDGLYTAFLPFNNRLLCGLSTNLLRIEAKLVHTHYIITDTMISEFKSKFQKGTVVPFN